MTEETAPQERQDGFFDTLPSYFQSHQLSGWFRVTKQGIFVHEAAAEPLLAAYQEWTKKTSPTGEGKTIEKCRKRLFGNEDRPLYYVLDGNRCLPGVVLSGENTDPRKSKIPVYQAALLPAADFLHPRDPYLTSVQNPKHRLSNQDGFVLEFASGKRSFEMSEGGLKEFAAALRSDPRERRAHPEILRSLRATLEPAARIISNAREVPDSQRLLIPERLRSKARLKYFRSHGLIFAVEHEKKIIGWFSTKGRALGYFLRSELDIIREKTKNGAGIRGFAPDSPKKHCAGKAFSQGIAFHLETRVLIQFLKQMPRVARVAKKIPIQFSLRDLLERFATLFHNSTPIDERLLLGKLRRREAYAKYRRTGNWLFVIVDKNVIHSAVVLRKLDDATGAPAPSTPQAKEG